MSFNIISARLTASPSSLGWSQVHEFAPEDKGKLEKRGRLYAVISTRNLDEKVKEGQTIDSVNTGREILSRLHEEYFGKTTESSFEVLKNAVSKIVEEYRDGQTEIEIIAVAHVSGVIYTVATGGSQLVILRSGSLARLLISRGKEVIAASGYPKESDVLILGTSAFFKRFSEGVIRGTLAGGDIKRAAESFAPAVHASDANPDLGVSFLKFNKSAEREATIKNISVEEGSSDSSEGLSAAKSISSKGGLSGRKKFNSDTDVSEKRFGLLRKLKGKIGSGGKSVYVRETEEPLESKNRRKVSASVGIILVLTLVVSVFFGIRQKGEKDYRLQYESELKEASHLLDESLSLYTIDIGRSRDLFNQSRSIVGGLIADGIEDAELDEINVQIKERQGDILGEYKAQVESFSDLTLITSGFSGKSMVGYGEEIYVLDMGGERIVSISVAAKKSKVEVGPAQLSNVEDFAIYDDRIFMINDDGIFEVSKTSKEKVSGKDWGGKVMLFAYTSNLYLLETDASDIWRYASTEGGFADKKSWLAEDIDTNLSETIDWVIDGTIWLLKKDGDIERFSQGNHLSFVVGGLAPALINGDAFYTDEDIENLYILDSGGKRIVVIDKDGNFKAQYLAKELAGAKDIVVSESEGKMIILKDGKLLSIEIKHQE